MIGQCTLPFSAQSSATPTVITFYARLSIYMHANIPACMTAFLWPGMPSCQMPAPWPLLLYLSPPHPKTCGSLLCVCAILALPQQSVLYTSICRCVCVCVQDIVGIGIQEHQHCCISSLFRCLSLLSPSLPLFPLSLSFATREQYLLLFTPPLTNIVTHITSRAVASP